MLVLSPDPKVAERQLVGLIFYLTTFGYIDGDFDRSERDFVRRWIRRVIDHRAKAALGDSASPAERQQVVDRYTAHFERVFEDIDRQIQDMFAEPVPEGETHETYVTARLELRCYEIFEKFDAQGQRLLLDTVDELLMADGYAHPEELRFRRELDRICQAQVAVELGVRWSEAPHVRVDGLTEVPSGRRDHELLANLEIHYADDEGERLAQLQEDCRLIREAMEHYDARRAEGAGRLAGKRSVQELQGHEPFLDGHVHVLPPERGRPVELTVVGDLHGCYSCLKAVVMQSRFIERVEAYERDPESAPRPGLVLLGDYVDRGKFSYHGVLRGALTLLTEFPDYVYMLRGNHELYLDTGSELAPAVRPADGLVQLKATAPYEVQKHYKLLFDALPAMLLFEQMVFVHAGIPKDETVEARYQDLSSLNDGLLRLQMMWSDPSSADAVPRELQDKATRFPFGRLQAQAFLGRIGCHTMFRAHQKLDAGFGRVYADDIQLFTLFSAGGATNADLPEQSNYRKVRPVAATVTYVDGDVRVTPWAVEYETYLEPELNRFYR